MNVNPCPICEFDLLDQGPDSSGRDVMYYSCPSCGTFGLTREARSLLGGRFAEHPDGSAILSHYIYQMQDENQWPVLNTKLFDAVLEQRTLPTPSEQAENLIRWLGKNEQGPGAGAEITAERHSAAIGAKSEAGLMFIVRGLQKKGLVDGEIRAVDQVSRSGEGKASKFASVALTFDGWEKFQELQLGVASGRKVFMAMPFGKPDIDHVVETCFRPAVSQVGFELRRLDDVPKAGLIDDRMRVEIKSSRFLLAELTYGNNGAYWEAGFAEGLRKHVIYTCEKSRFGKDAHFDTNHHLTIVWSADHLEDAADRLKATIRATLPDARRENS